MPPSEKRRHPRIQDCLTLRSRSPEGESSEMSTSDLSLGGASVVSHRFLPLMTRVEVILHLPPDSDAGARPRPVKAEAVVVRVEPPEPVETGSSYRLALFFSHLDPPDRSALARYLSSFSRGA